MITRLPPTEFTYTRYDMMTLPWKVIREKYSYIQALLDLNIIGYCDSIDCEIRPRPDEYAVMFYDEAENYQTWAHIPLDIFDAYLEELK